VSRNKCAIENLSSNDAEDKADEKNKYLSTQEFSSTVKTTSKLNMQLIVKGAQSRYLVSLFSQSR